MSAHPTAPARIGPDVRARLRVVAIYAGWPADPAYLAEIDSAVDLTVYHCAWPAGRSGPDVRHIQRRTFTPLVKSRRGHLTYWYPGLRRALDRDRPEVVHVLSEPWGLLSVQAARWVRANNAKIVMHGCDTIWHHGSALEQRLRRLLLRHTLRVPGGFAAENTTALGLARAGGQRPSNINARIHTNPRDARTWRAPTPAERAAARVAIGVGPETTAVGFLGRLVPPKGVAQFLDAADELIDRGCDVRFFIAGQGPLASLVAERQSAAIVALGRLTHPDGVLQYFRVWTSSLARPSARRSGRTRARGRCWRR